MNIVVCLKQVPDTTDVKIDPETHTLIREGIPSIINPVDMYAIEEAIRLKERFGGRVTAMTLGPPQSLKALTEAVAMGVDEAIQLCDRAFAGSDSWATSYTLALAIRKLGEFDLVLCGKQAIDGDTGQVGPGIASQLDIAQLTYVFKIVSLDPEARLITVERLLEEGREIVAASLPALLTVVKDINQPRSASLFQIREASKRGITIWTAADLPGADPSMLGLKGSPTQVIQIFSPPARTGAVEFIEAGTVRESAAILAERIIAEKIL
ncbi:MAG: electron transfer flavoprotein subunit beta/FixA family protein [Pseudomonadota bacterium]|nr:electron transfer flavoprotein subunit beta/FixA family protein [Pseudomonadota bacterium]